MADPFQPKFVDLVRNGTTTTGTGNFALGAAPAGYTSFAAAVQPGESFYYSAIGIDKPAEREVGRGTMQANGTISRDPITGPLTDFTTGNKTLSLVAAAEWFTTLQAGGGGTAAAASRTELAALGERSQPVVLHEPGREGIFVFDAANLSVQVTGDPAQGLHVAPASAPSGSAGAWVRQFDGAMQASWFGAKGDGTSDDTAALQAAINQAGLTRQLQLTGGTYRVTALTITAPDVTIVAHGAVITSDRSSLTATLTMDKARCKIIGGTWKLTSGSDNPWHFDIYDPGCELDGVRMVKEPAAGHYQAYIRHWAQDFTMRNCVAEGSNGFFIEARNSGFFDNRLIARDVGGDDCFAVKALNDSVHNVRIEGNYIENYAAGLSIGSEVGSSVPDPTYSLTAGQIVFTGNTLRNCGGIAFIKPGGIAPADYFDGTVEDVVISNNTLVDETGTKFERGIAITPARGARVRRVYGTCNTIRARSSDTVGRRIGALDVRILDTPGGTAEADVSSVDVQIDFDDGHDGQVSGASHPGQPVTHVASVSNATESIGTMSEIVIDLHGNGSAEAGLFVGAGLDDAVKVRAAHLRNVNRTAGASQGGIYLLSRIQAADGDVSVSAASGPPLKVSGSGELVTVIEAGKQGGTAAVIRPAASASSLILRSPDNSDEVSIGNNGSTFTGAITSGGQLTSTGSALVARGAGASFAGKSAFLDVDNGIARVGAFEDGVGYFALNLEASTISIKPAGGGAVLAASSGSVSVTGSLSATGNIAGANLTGTNSGDQTITLTGDISGSGSGSFVTAIGANKVTYAKLQNLSASGLLLGRATAGAGVVEEIALANGLAMSGTALGLGAITPSSVATSGGITSSGTAGNGYSAGAGGTVTQTPNKSSAVTLNKICGRVTMNNASLAASASVSFTLTNSTIAASDLVIVNIASAGAANSYFVTVDAVAAGSCRIHLRNTSAGALAEALVLNFAVFKSVIA